MFASTSNRACIAIFLLLPLAALLAGCAVPLAPGYQVEKESLTVHFASGTPPHLAIRADYQLKNVGTTPLDSLEVAVPCEKAFGRSSLRVLVANREVTAHSEQDTDSEPGESAAAESMWRIPLVPALRKKQKINVSLAYDLSATAATDSRIFAAENMFYLNDSGWFPEFQEPKAFFAEDITRPNPTELTIVAPPNFLVTASGQPRGEKKTNAEAEHHFRIATGDFDPYVLAGAYQQQKISANSSNVAIWTLKPIPAAQAQQTATQIAAAENFYVQNFGPLPRALKEIYDVQLPEEVNEANIIWRRWEDSLLPGVVFDSFGTSPNMSNSSGPTELGNTWFGHMIRPGAEAWMFDFVLAAYSSDLLGESTGTSRAEAISSDLSDYDGTSGHAIEKPIVSLTPSDAKDQLRLGGDKLELFLLALEDRCGRENVVHAMHHMVYALRGQQYGYSDFRAALEQECHQDLAGFFRTWLTQPGIPPDFRARYQPGAAKQ